MMPRSDQRRWRWTGKACLLIGVVAHLTGCDSPAEKAYWERYARAKAVFEERCKTAGAVVHRTVLDVEGIELTKHRQPVPLGGKQYFDPMWPEAAMGGEVRGDSYIKQFLMHEFLDARYPDRRGYLGPPTIEKMQKMPSAKKGYAFVEILHPDGERLRCEPDWSKDHPNWVDGQHHCRSVTSSSTRYALDYDDILDPVDRQHWIAGTRLKVTDKQSGEVIATLTKFVWDQGFGVSTTGRWPWQHADGRGDRNCPYVQFQPTGNDSRYFVDAVLIPKQGD